MTLGNTIAATFVAMTMMATSALGQTLPFDIRDVVNRPSPDISRSDVVNPNSDFYRESGAFSNDGARVTMIQNAARGVGIRAGFVAEAEQINAIMFQRYRSVMDRHFNFRPLLMQNGVVVPPVVTRIQGVRELPSSRLLYSAQVSYEIVKEPRLTTLPPSWMDYVLLPISDVRPPTNISLENQAERDAWRTSAGTGWEEGVREARLAFVDAFNILARDYTGMQLYHELARQGFISIPVIDVSTQATRIDENGRRAFINERAVRLVAGSQFQFR